ITNGRWVTDAEPTAAYVINETLARRAFGNANPIGTRLQIDGPRGGTEAQGARFATIVGVVADQKDNNLNIATEPDVFIDLAHSLPAVMKFVARTEGDPLTLAPTLRSMIASVDPLQSVGDIRTVEAVLNASIAPRRFTMFLFALFAGLALLLA